MIFGLLILVLLLAFVGMVSFALRAVLSKARNDRALLGAIVCAVVAVVAGMTLVGATLTSV